MAWARTPPPDACRRWAKRPATSASADAVRDESTIEATYRGAFAHLAGAVLQYRIYPKIKSRVCTPDGHADEGCIIVQRACFGPVAVEAGCRVTHVERRRDRIVMEYVTLRGHPERGRIRFEVTRIPRGGRLRLASVSEPGTWWSRLGRRAARRLQVRWTRNALERLRQG